jgi:hypothetical protein
VHLMGGSIADVLGSVKDCYSPPAEIEVPSERSLKLSHEGSHSAKELIRMEQIMIE